MLFLLNGFAHFLWVILKYATTYNHPQPSITTHNHPQPPTTTHNHPQPSTTTHNYSQLSTITYNHPQQPTTIHNQPQPSTTSHNQPQPSTTTHNHPQPPKNYTKNPKLITSSQDTALTGPLEQGGREGVSTTPPQSYLLMCPFLLMSPLNVLFLKDVTKNIDENQQAKSRAS